MKTIAFDKEFRIKQRVPYKKIDSRTDFFKIYGFSIRKEAQGPEEGESENSINSEHDNDDAKKGIIETNKNKDIPETKENSDIIEAFLVHRKVVDGVREITVKNSNKSIVKNFGKSLRGRSMREATEKDYLDYLDTKRAYPTSFNTTRETLLIFREFLSLPRFEVKKMKVPDKLPLDLTQAQADADKILVQATNDVERNVIILGRKGGMSSEDVCDVKRENFKILAHHVQLDYTRKKTGVGASIVIIDKAHVIAGYLEHNNFKPGDYLFISKTGKNAGHPLKPAGVYTIVKRLSDRAGVYWHPHLFRHLLATELARRGDTKWDLDNELGWSHSSNTASIYVNLASDETNKKHLERAGLNIKPRETEMAKLCWQCGMSMDGDQCMRCGAFSNAKKTTKVESNQTNTQIEPLQQQMDSFLDLFSKLLGNGKLVIDVKTGKLLFVRE